MVITSSANQQVRNLIQLRKKAKAREEQDVFLVEGIRMYEEVPRDKLVQTFVSAGFWNRQKELFRDAEPVVLSDAVFEAVSDTKTPQGILCVVKQYHYRLEDLYVTAKGPQGRRRPFLMVLENLQDPGNLGTILRTAEGAGATGILLSEGCVDIYNPKVIRSTMGSVYRVPFCYVDSLPYAIHKMKKLGIRFCAAHLQGAVSYETQDYTGPVGFVIGNESRGLTKETASAADVCVRIPMCGQVESLNAGVASAVLMYEAARQRRMSYSSRPAGE